MIHLKIEVCQTVEIVDLAKSIFNSASTDGKKRKAPDEKALVVLHKGKHENPHWHLQGQTTLSPKDLVALVKSATEKHSKYIAAPNARPWKQSKKDVNELGFQYMMKETPPVVVYSQGFTQEELDELHVASDEHVKGLKDSVYDYCAERVDLKVKTVVEEASEEVKNYYNRKNKTTKEELEGRVRRARYPDGKKKVVLADDHPAVVALKNWAPEVPPTKTTTTHQDPKAVHTQMRILGIRYYAETKKMPPPNFQKLVLHAMLRISQRDEVYTLYEPYFSTHF